jgi:hypothetical protein
MKTKEKIGWVLLIACAVPLIFLFIYLIWEVITIVLPDIYRVTSWGYI